jgi:hypothetical protein
MADLFGAEMLAEVPRERINPDAFDGLCVAMQCVEFTAALRVAEILPVGGFVASACEARLFDEGFQQYRAIDVARVPVLVSISLFFGHNFSNLWPLTRKSGGVELLELGI